METKRYKWGLNTYETYKIRPSKKKVLVGGLFSSISLVVPDLMIGTIIGSSVMSPIGFKKNIKNKIEDLNYNIRRWIIRRKR